MFNRIVYILFFISCAAACKRTDQTETFATENQPGKIVSKGYSLSKDSIAAPDTIKALPAVPFQIEKINELSARSNVRIAGQPREITAGKPRVTTPGSGGFSLPADIKLIPKVVRCVQPEPVAAQRPRFKDNATCNIQYLDVDQGLPSSYIYKLYEDKLGYMWFGSSAGLTKYDGTSFLNYSEKQGFNKGSARDICEDETGNIWIGSHGGLTKFDGENFFYYNEEGQPGSNTKCLIRGGKGLLWIGTDNGLICYDGNKFISYGEKEGLIGNNIYRLFEDRKGNIWCGTDKGVSKFDGKSFTSYTEQEGLLSNRVNAIAQDKEENIWMTFENGVGKFTGNSFFYYTDKEGLINNTVRNVLADMEGNIWFTVYHGGLSHFDGKNFTYLRENEGISINTAWNIIEDRAGNIWIGTDGGGISKYSSRSFTHFTANEGMNNVVMNISSDRNNHLWLATYGGGLCEYDGTSFSYYKDKNGVINTVGGLYRDKDNNLWAGCEQGIFLKYDGNSFLSYALGERFRKNTISCLSRSANGDLWLGTNNSGAFKFNGKEFLQYSTPQGLSNSNIKAIAEDRKGNIWIGTTKGLNKLSGSSVTRFTEKEGLSHNNIKNILVDHEDNIWIGTLGGGLNKYDGNSFTRVSEKEGLSNNFIRGIVEEEVSAGEKKGIWVSTDNGINHLLTDTGKTGVRIIIYKRNDGLKGEDFCSNSAYRDNDNRIWWGSVKSLTMFDAGTASPELTIPQVKLNTIYLEQKFSDFRSILDAGTKIKNDSIYKEHAFKLNRIKFNGVPPFYNYPLNPELPYDINNITFNFSALDWNFPHKIKYQYILEGADREWRQMTSETQAIYTNLGSGNYTFKVKSKGFSEIWSQPFEYHFIINPPWWKTLWAYFLYVFIILSGFFLFFKWRTKALLDRQKILEQTIVERTADVVEEKNKVEEKNLIIERKQQEIVDSINYAKQIQYSLLANEEILRENLPQHFVLFKPKDIVSGDFYWATVVGSSELEVRRGSVESASEPRTLNSELFYLAVCDSTGHGVPGAFMSLLNISFLNEAVNEKNIREPNKVLDHVRSRLIKSMEGQDGMDATLMCFNNKNVSYASAHNKPLLIRNGKITELSADKMPVGKGIKSESFQLYSLEVMEGDCIYFYTDGYADQFGGPKGKKFKYKQLEELLLSINNDSMSEQKQKLKQAFENWKGSLEQVDDVCIIGVRL